MTTVYFVRHAQPNYENHDDMTRELSPKGQVDCELVKRFFEEISVDAVLSSPFKRAYDTVLCVSLEKKLPLKVVYDFRERKIDTCWINDFESFSKAQWNDFSFKLSDGESLSEVQNRNVGALNAVLRENQGKTVVVGSHGTALSTIINYYDNSFDYECFEKYRKLMPWIVEFTFDGSTCININHYDVFKLYKV